MKQFKPGRTYTVQGTPYVCQFGQNIHKPKQWIYLTNKATGKPEFILVDFS